MTFIKDTVPCAVKNSVGHGGKGDVAKHSSGPGHTKAKEAANTRAINSFFTRAEPRSTLDRQVRLPDS